jgi:hypothetical protein
MQYLLLVYTDPELLDAAPAGTFDAEMRQCLEHADELQSKGTLLGFQQLEPAQSAKSLRVRAEKPVIMDGPFAETKEVLMGFNLVEAASMAEAMRLAQELPWARYGCIEVRPVADVAAVRQRVGARGAK